MSEIRVDTISEKTSANGVAVDGVTLKDGKVSANAGVVVDELTIDADTITATDDFIIDAVGDITLDAADNQIDEEEVRFNGVGDNGHETFYLSRVQFPRYNRTDKSKYFNFCKTARKPYDKYVVKVLILMEKYFGDDVEIDSDGDWDHIKKEEYIEHVLKREVNSTISSLEGLIQNVYDLIGDLQKGRITTEDIPDIYKQWLE